MRPPHPHVLIAAAGALGALALVACNTPTPSRPVTRDPGLELVDPPEPTTDDAIPDDFAGTDDVWEDIVAAIAEQENAGGAGAATPEQPAPARPVTADEDPPVVVDPNPPITPTTEAIEASAPQTTEPPQPEESATDRVARLVSELASTIGITAATSDDPVREAVRLVLLEGAGDKLNAGATLELERVLPLLTPNEREGVEHLRALLEGLREGESLDAPTLARALRAKSEAMSEHRPVSIAGLALCRDVRRFGVYTPFKAAPDGTYRFLAGRRQRTIVYVEVEDFVHETTSAEAGFEIELSMEATLVRRADGVLARRLAPTTVREITRRPLRDLFLRSMFELPPTLTVGLYDLKVTIRDRNDDNAIAERLIPIEVVGDHASLSGVE